MSAAVAYPLYDDEEFCAANDNAPHKVRGDNVIPLHPKSGPKIGSPNRFIHGPSFGAHCGRVYNAAGALVHVDEDTDNKQTDYVKAGGMAVARVTGTGGVLYEHADLLGSPRSLTNVSGSPDEQAYYSPFGMEYGNTNVKDDQAGFTGHIKDKATGLNYMQARYYDPVMGRFLSVDPVGFVDTGDTGYFNRYAYTFNNPINNIDPDGQQVFGNDDPDHPTPPPLPFNVDGLITPQKTFSQKQLFKDVGFNERGPGERANALMHPGSINDAIEAKDIGNAASEDFFAEVSNDNPLTLRRKFLNGGPGDAMRHGVASAELTKRTGPKVAKAFGDAHERSVTNTAGARAQDLINNYNGSVLMQKNKNANVNVMINFAVNNGFMQNTTPAIGP
ncbi:MAG: RHS repeat-associated core domain-containing protein [Maricaulaceae bacterium]